MFDSSLETPVLMFRALVPALWYAGNLKSVRGRKKSDPIRANDVRTGPGGRQRGELI